MKKNILITGGSGFLGRELIRQLSFENLANVVAISQSEKRVCDVSQIYPNVDFYCLDLASDKNNLEHIIKKHEIEYIIHCAAMKHVNICEKNPYRAIDVNINGSKNIIDLFQENKLKNLIGISTDKASNPTCVYGTTKFLMEKIFLEKGGSVFRGVNFLFSDGSVLDIWTNQMKKGLPLSVNVRNTTRFFINVEDASKKIIQNLDTKNSLFLPDECYKIELHDLAKAFCILHNYNLTKDFYDDKIEKMIEEISPEIKVKNADVKTIIKFLENYYSKNV